MKFLKILFTCLTLICAGANASVYRYQLNNVVFDDGMAGSGTIDIDTVTQNLVNFNVWVPDASFLYTPQTSCVTCAWPTGSISGNTLTLVAANPTPGATSRLQLTLDSGWNLGDPVIGIQNGPSSFDAANDENPSWYFTVTSGNLVFLGAVPEPTSVAMLALGLSAIALALRGRRSIF